MLKVEGLRAVVGGVEAVKAVDLRVAPGGILALIGANGAGKTTTLRALSGLVPAAGGKVLLDGRDITRLPAHERIRAGLAHVPEGRRIFPGLTVRENLEVAAWTRPRARDRVDEALALFPGLRGKLGQGGGTLSGGEQQLLAMARAVVTGGKVLLLDEPSMGLAPNRVEEVFDRIQAINERGMAILLVEQNAAEALRIAHEACVLAGGRTVLSGPARRIAGDPAVRAAYLGV